MGMKFLSFSLLFLKDLQRKKYKFFNILGGVFFYRTEIPNFYIYSQLISIYKVTFSHDSGTA